MHKVSWSGGHTDSVLSLDVNTEGILASGSEDCLCVWTKEGSPATKIIPDDTNLDVTSVCFSRRFPEQLYASTGNKIHCYDLRNLGNQVYEFEVNDDEINQIAVHEKGKYLCACDDSGAIRVIDLQDRRLFKTLRTHTNICSTVQFRPHRPWGVVSGGMDYRVVHWDFSNGRVLHEVNVQELGSGQLVDGYMMNPPFVHSIHVADNGRSFAAGLEDGTVQVFNFEGKKQFVPHGKLKKHRLGVCQVHFPHFEPLGNIVVSGSNDKHIMVWSLWERQAENGNCDTDAGAAAIPAEPRAVHDVDHGAKVNWITSSSFSGKKTIYIADPTNEISLYEFLD